MIQLHNEDCYETLSKLQDRSVDMILQDLPYGVTQNDWDNIPDLEKMWEQWLRVMNNGCV